MCVTRAHSDRHQTVTHDNPRVRFGVALGFVLGCARGGVSHLPDGSSGGDAPRPPPDAPVVSIDAPGFTPTLDGNRNRLLATYLARLHSIPTTVQSNGLVGSALANVCDLWNGLDPSSRDVFLTITHRLDGSELTSDHTKMLDHVTKLYRVMGGQGATTTNPGSCGGGEYNRLIMSMDPQLHDTQLAANTHQGAVQPSGFRDLADIPTNSYWRQSNDTAGPHTPFDLSDETNAGAPRGQTQYFRDPASTVATSPLGRMDVSTVVDPYALEMDQDYDCPHNSNPSCTYVFYGPLCAPMTSQVGATIYKQDYGDFGTTWKPTGC
jgi:hypothetical protein